MMVRGAGSRHPDVRQRSPDGEPDGIGVGAAPAVVADEEGDLGGGVLDVVEGVPEGAGLGQRCLEPHRGEGLAQVVFFLADDVCETSYADRGGKYMKQTGITIPRM